MRRCVERKSLIISEITYVFENISITRDLSSL